MATSSDWLIALDAPPQPAAPRWFEALDDSAGFQVGAPFAPATRGAEPQTPVAAPSSPATPADDAAAALAQAFAEGEAAGRTAARAEADEAAQHARALRLNFRAFDEAALAVLADELAATVQSLCEQVLGDYAIDPVALAARCEAAAARLGKGWPGAVLHLHPDDYAALPPAALEGWQVTHDPALARGSLLVEAADGAVRDGPEDWRRALAEALRP